MVECTTTKVGEPCATNPKQKKIVTKISNCNCFNWNAIIVDGRDGLEIDWGE